MIKEDPEAETKPTNAPVRNQPINYTVKSGDTLSSIATKFNISLNTLLWENNLNLRSTLSIGKELTILPTSGISHTVSSGETLSSIARKYGTTSDKIAQYNNINNHIIQKKQELIIPGGSKQVTVASVAKPKISSIKKVFTPAPTTSVTSSRSGFLWPAAARTITQYYNWRHKGLDIGAPTGTAIYASESGTVERSGWSTGYGYNILINHGNGYKTVYAHASKLYVKTGQTVSKGQVIMAMGSTGWSTGPHLHFEIRVNGVKKNPLSYIK